MMPAEAVTAVATTRIIQRQRQHLHGFLVVKEVAEIITISDFDDAVVNVQDPTTFELSDIVQKQLYAFVHCIISRYHDSPFHNFEHALHMTMSVSKLLSCIITPQHFHFAEICNGRR